jgi:mono/diheme cytochrome c family protein
MHGQKIFSPTRLRRALASGLALCLAAGATGALAQGFGGGGYPQQTGEALYQGICQGCHMPDAKGAVGAGAYPALAENRKLAAKAYPELVVLRGQKAMPAFGPALTDAQVAAVVTYVRTHFGNSYADSVTADDVKALRATLAGK